MTHRWRLSALVFGVGLTLLAIGSLESVLQARATVTTIATRLVNPRGLNFGPDGALYVAEAGSGGSGPCVLGSDGLVKCYGTTGAVTKIVLGGPASRVVTGLPSIAALPGTMGAGIGTGPHDVDFQGLGNGFVTIGFGADPDKRLDPAFASVGLQFGRFVRFKPNGKWTFEEDLAGFENDKNPDGVDPPDSNPYGVLAGPGRTIYTDAGGNALNAVAANGSISNLAVFPRGAAPFPPFQAVPTSVAVGPDGALYVGQLTGGPFPDRRRPRVRVPAERRDSDGLRRRLHEDHRHRVRQRRLALRARNQRDRRWRAAVRATRRAVPHPAGWRHARRHHPDGYGEGFADTGRHRGRQ